MKKIIEIPEGYEARIEGNKAILESKESEDERIRNSIRLILTDASVKLFAIHGVAKEDVLAWLEKQGKQKHAWTEEDEKFFKTALWHISYSVSNGKTTDDHCDTTDWLKSLKERYTWKPSDEQMNTLWDAIVYVEGCDSNFKGSGSVLENLYSDLKKLKR